MAKSKKDVEGGLGIHARRAIAYIVLIIISFFLPVLVLYHVYQCDAF